MMKLKFSSVQQPELSGFLALLKLSDSSIIDIEEIIGYCDASLSTADDQVISDRKVIAMKLAQLSENNFGLKSQSCASSSEDLAKIEQIFTFAYDSIESSVSTSHPDISSIFEILNEMLMKSTFLIGNAPSASDALIFSMLHSRIRALVPTNQLKYFRVLRWFLQMQHQFTADLSAIFNPLSVDLKALEGGSGSAGGVPEKAMAKLSLQEAKEKKQKDKKSASGAGAAASTPAVAVDAPVICRVDLRVGKIVDIEKHPNADRLYIEKVDFGEAELRTVVSGLVEHVPIDELKDRMCMFICNLKPATICKVQSTAMLLVAKNDTQGLEPLIIPPSARPGDRICIAGLQAQPDGVIKPAKEPQLSIWDEVRKDLSVDSNGIAMYKDSPLQVVGLEDPIRSSKIAIGTIG